MLATTVAAKTCDCRSALAVVPHITFKTSASARRGIALGPLRCIAVKKSFRGRFRRKAFINRTLPHKNRFQLDASYAGYSKTLPSRGPKCWGVRSRLTRRVRDAPSPHFPVLNFPVISRDDDPIAHPAFAHNQLRASTILCATFLPVRHLSRRAPPQHAAAKPLPTHPLALSFFQNALPRDRSGHAQGLAPAPQNHMAVHSKFPPGRTWRERWQARRARRRVAAILLSHRRQHCRLIAAGMISGVIRRRDRLHKQPA
jgi:hypothetical protein